MQTRKTCLARCARESAKWQPWRLPCYMNHRECWCSPAWVMGRSVKVTVFEKTASSKVGGSPAPDTVRDHRGVKWDGELPPTVIFEMPLCASLQVALVKSDP